jgi:hypothetical protein
MPLFATYHTCGGVRSGHICGNFYVGLVDISLTAYKLRMGILSHLLGRWRSGII